MAAAQAKRDAPAPAPAYALLAIAEMRPLSDLQQARVAHLRAQMEFARGRGGDDEAPRIVEAASKLLARHHLNEAHEMFTRMGAQAFAERARREHVATGEKVRKQPFRSGDELSAQEAQIARLAGTT